MKTKGKIITASLFFLSIFASSCEETLEEYIHRQAEEFGALYFNHKIRESKPYCTYEMQPIMDFRNYNLSDRERNLLKKQKEPATVKTVYSFIDLLNERAYVSLEVKNFVHVDYLKDTSYLVECDTIELIFKQLSLDKHIWRIMNPF